MQLAQFHPKSEAFIQAENPRATPTTRTADRTIFGYQGKLLRCELIGDSTQFLDRLIRVSGGSVAFIAGVNWGSGTLTYRRHHYSLKVGGISVGSIGASKFDAVGEVYNLHRPNDIEGTYAAVEASATAGMGAGS